MSDDFAWRYFASVAARARRGYDFQTCRYLSFRHELYTQHFFATAGELFDAARTWSTAALQAAHSRADARHLRFAAIAAMILFGTKIGRYAHLIGFSPCRQLRLIYRHCPSDAFASRAAYVAMAGPTGPAGIRQ